MVPTKPTRFGHNHRQANIICSQQHLHNHSSMSSDSWRFLITFHPTLLTQRWSYTEDARRHRTIRPDWVTTRQDAFETTICKSTFSLNNIFKTTLRCPQIPGVVSSHSTPTHLWPNYLHINISSQQHLHSHSSMSSDLWRLPITPPYNTLDTEMTLYGRHSSSPHYPTWLGHSKPEDGGRQLSAVR